MSLKQEIQTWVKALAHYDAREYEAALSTFDDISDTSKILFNCGVIHATLGEHGKAIDFYRRAVQLDQYLAVAYFQQGVSSFLCGDFEEALANFNDTLYYLRGNHFIDYEQLGLNFKLHYCEVLFNRGLCFIYTQQRESGMQDLNIAAREKAVSDHSVIDDAVRDQAEGYTVFSIPVGVLYRPNEAKVRNLGTRVYLPKPQLVAQQHRRQLSAQELGHVERSERSWTGIKETKSGIPGRTRQCSEPPMNRSMFPPTPPPESEKPFFPNSSRLRDLPAPLKIDTKNLSRQHAPSRVDSARSPLSSETSAQPHKARSANRMAAIFHGSPSSLENISRVFYRRHSRTPTVSTLGHTASINEEPEVEAEGTTSPINSTSSCSPKSRLGHGEPATDTATQTHKHSVEQAKLSTPIRPPNHSTTTLSPRSRTSSTTHDRRPSQAMKRIRVKLHTSGDDLRHTTLEAGADFATAATAMRAKLGLDGEARIRIRFRDEEGDLVTLGDEEDWAMAVEVARRAAMEEWQRGWQWSDGGETGRLELWVE